MPHAQRCAELLETSSSGLVGIRRGLLSELMKRFHNITLPDSPSSLDDGITSYIVTSIGPSEGAIHSSLPYYLAFLKYIVKKLNLNIEISGLPEEEKEERRRLDFDVSCISCANPLLRRQAVVGQLHCRSSFLPIVVPTTPIHRPRVPGSACAMFGQHLGEPRIS